jgi:hypothetical protein
VATTPALGVTTGLNPGGTPNPAPVADLPIAPANAMPNGLLVLSGAIFVIGLLLLVVRRVAVRSAR